MWKLEINPENNQELVIRKEDGKLLGTYHAQHGIVPMTWKIKYNNPEFMKSMVDDVWGEILNTENFVLK